MIAKAAGVSIGWLYDFFPNRESIFDAIVATSLDKVTPIAEAVHDSRPGRRLARGSRCSGRRAVRLLSSRARLSCPVVLQVPDRGNDRGQPRTRLGRRHGRVRTFGRHGLDLVGISPERALHLVIGIIDKGLDLAFRIDPDGDRDDRRRDDQRRGRLSRTVRRDVNALAIDLGSTACKASVIALDGACSVRPDADADDVWRRMGWPNRTRTASGARRCPLAGRRSPQRALRRRDAVRSMCVASQWSSIVPVDANGVPVAPFHMWFDRRGQALADALVPDAAGEAARRWAESMDSRRHIAVAHAVVPTQPEIHVERWPTSSRWTTSTLASRE